MDLAQFRANYANQTGSVEWVPLALPPRESLFKFHNSRNQLNFFTSANNNPQDQIFIFFSDEKSVGVKTMRKSVLFPFSGHKFLIYL
jgi:DNA-directed RNA polymerase I, II, and III subunit RPABC1